MPAAFMVTLLLVVFDWSSLRTFHVEWLLTIAEVLLWTLLGATVFVVLTMAFIALALRAERVELGEGRLRRRIVFGRAMEVPIEGAILSRGKSGDVVTASVGGRRVVVPHLFYAVDDRERLWAASGLAEPPASE